MSGECDKKTHPWGRFLIARWEAILWMHEEMGYNDKQIAQNLSMDKMQVYLIRTSEHMHLTECKKETDDA